MTLLFSSRGRNDNQTSPGVDGGCSGQEDEVEARLGELRGRLATIKRDLDVTDVDIGVWIRSAPRRSDAPND